MRTVETINAIIMCLFFLCYSYQFLYIPIALLSRPKPHAQAKQSRIAILIAARNEEAVISNLLDSIDRQTYPRHLLQVFVCADNCTDRTAAIAREHGAAVFRRTSPTVGKGYVLHYMLSQISESYDAYVVLDADNILDPNFLEEINRVHSDGYEIVTCYRNSKNYGDNWISAGYALWFLREAQYLNRSRMSLGSSCAVSGTGFLFSRDVLERCGGWHFFLLTEDIEFTIDNIIRGERVGYARKAIIYDEQPTKFSQSWTQRLRWAKGYLQVFRNYGGGLIRGIFRGSFSCYDMAMNIMPAAILTGISLVVNTGAAVYSFFWCGSGLAQLGFSVLQSAVSLYLTMFALGLITTISEWKQIHCSAPKKLLYAFTFPLFMLTYIPICFVSLFAKGQWTAIRHDRALTFEQITGGK